MPIKADKSLRAYYNEIDPFAAQWMRNLMAEGWITKGDVDERSIEDVKPSDLAGYDRLHFFAGVAVWDYALNQAGWGRGEIWTGSCPCQPFSSAGAGAGFDDERHLWPAFHWLIEQCRPPEVLGEQVASKDADPWIDLVSTDLEGLGYAVGAVAFPAASVGAPHIRDRLYWMGHANNTRHARNGGAAGRERTQRPASTTSISSGLGNTDSHRARRDGRSLCGPVTEKDREHSTDDADASSRFGGPAHAEGAGFSHGRPRLAQPLTSSTDRSDCATRPSPTNGYWADSDWLLCRDGKWRPVEPGTSPLANGAPARVGRVRAYGNAIVAPQAQAFIEAVMHLEQGTFS